VGSIRYWPILVNPTDGGTATQALLLGPLSIDQEFAGKGIGRALTFKTLELAAGLGYGLVLLVGDIDYYKRFGFVPATPYGFVMPGESRPHRLQVAALRDGILEPGQATGGEICHIHSGEPALLTTASAAPNLPNRPRRGHRRAANANGRSRLA